MEMSACFLGVKLSMDKPVISGNKIVVPSDQAFLPVVDDFLEATLRGFGADEEVIADIAISVTELVNNAMLHGNKSSADKSVTIEITRKKDKVTIIVIDEGMGFDPDIIPDPLAQENLMKEVGRGIFIVRSMMDKVELMPSAEGTAVSITKTI
jgi:serine/threonine-protein kinase RsbW